MVRCRGGRGGCRVWYGMDGMRLSTVGFGGDVGRSIYRWSRDVEEGGVGVRGHGVGSLTYGLEAFIP